MEALRVRAKEYKEQLLGSHQRAGGEPLLPVVLKEVSCKDHILVLLCSLLCVEELLGICCRLRTLQLQQMCPVLIMATELPSGQHFQSLSSLQDVWFFLVRQPA